MPTLLGNAELKAAVLENGFIKGGSAENIDGIKYDFCLSSKILKSKFGQPMDASLMPETMKSQLIIEPGEVVFVLSEEVVVLPNNIMAILIPKRKLSHDGIMILGGLSVDPLYEGRLLIGLYNLSSTNYPIIPGRKLIGSHFYFLNDNERDNVSTPQVKILSFPDELVRLMQSYKPVSTEALQNNVANLESKFEALLQELRSKDDWFAKLQDSMEKHEKNIDKILQGLEKEGDDRRDSDKMLEKKVDGIQGEIKEYMKSAYKTAGAVGGIGTLLAIIISLVLYFISNNNMKQTITNSATDNKSQSVIDSLQKRIIILQKDTVKIK